MPALGAVYQQGGTLDPTPEFAHALRLVLSLPDGASAAEVRKDPRCEDAAMLISLTLESIAIMVHRRMTSLDLVWELMGGVVLAAWRKIHLWVRDQRQEQGAEKFDEWVEWLCDQMQRLRADEDPAYVKYRDWKPRPGGTGS